MHYSFQLTYKNYFLALLFVLSSIAYAQTEQDSIKPGYSINNLKLPDPDSILNNYEFDPITNRYIYSRKIGEFNIDYPVILTPKEYYALILKDDIRQYYKDKLAALDGKTEEDEEKRKDLIPEMYVNSDLFTTIFGGNIIDINPKGSFEVDFGVLYTKQDNPSFSPRNRSNLSLDFDQRISLSLQGKIGTRLNINTNYDTQSTFDFQNLLKLDYTPTEDDILQTIEVGNVSMPISGSLITGAQSLFGVKTELKFGATKIAAVFSEQKSQSKTVVSQGGGTLEEFEVFINDYDENRHFFLSQYFYKNYDKSLERYPFINNNTQVTRLEVWVTNRTNNTDNVRNIVCFQDLGESENIGLDSAPPNFFNVAPNSFPDNGNNKLDPLKLGQAGYLLTEGVRDISQVENSILTPANEGFDYGKLENARKLIEGQDYTLNTQLGYISLNQRLTNDEVLAVAYQYTVGGEVYQVGEFANGGIDSTTESVDEDVNINPELINNSLILKMLKSAVVSVAEPNWNLMMKNIYDTGAYQLSNEDFRFNIFYNEASPLNYIKPVEGTSFPVFSGGTIDTSDDTQIQETPLIRLFNLDRLNFNNDPQAGGDGFFDYVPGITVMTENGKIIFNKVQPFGEYLFDILDDPENPGDYEDDTYTNKNQEKYVYDALYKTTKTAALDENDKNKFLLKGKYKSSGGDGIPLGAFNVPRGSVKVTAGGRVLIEGVDYTVNYQIGRVQILDEALKASNTPIEVSVENNAVFGQQTKRFAGVNVEHQFSKDFILGGTFLSLNERPLTQKADYGAEPTSNKIFGFNGTYSTEVPFLTRMVNKLPNTDTDAISNFSARGEFAYLSPGAPKGTDFDGQSTVYVEDFEGTQGNIDLLSPNSWFMSSRPKTVNGVSEEDSSNNRGKENGYDRAFLNWYTIDPIFYSARRPTEITDDDVSNVYTRRVYINEVFPEVDLVQGQLSVINTLDLNYYPNERGPFNYDPQAANDILTNPRKSWAGITRQISSTDFEQANVEYIDFWLQDPFLDNPTNPGGKLFLNLGNISEDVLKDGKKQFENGLPEDGNISFLNSTEYETVVPQTQSLVYTYATTGQERTNQDVGYDGYDDNDEKRVFNKPNENIDFGEDPSKDNYKYFLNTEGTIFERYKLYNGTEGNSLEAFSDTNRAATAQPDVEDINRDNTMNTIDSYFEYEVEISPLSLSDENNKLINDRKTRTVTLANGDQREVVWYQFRIPIAEYNDKIGGINDIRSIRFARMYLNDFQENTIFRFASLDLVRSDWRRYRQSLKNPPVEDPNFVDTEFNVGVVGIQQNDGNYVSPPGVVQEQLNNNNNIVRQNEQSLALQVCDLESEDSRGVYKNINVDMRQYKRLKMFMHAHARNTDALNDNELIGFIRMGNDITQNFYQIEFPLKVTEGNTVNPNDVWPNEIDLELALLQQIKSSGISDGTLTDEIPKFYNVNGGTLTEVPEFASFEDGQLRISVKGNPNFGDIRSLMLGVKNSTDFNKCAEVWFNEMRLAELENKGGWASVASIDTNFADFANVSVNGRRSTVGFGSLEQKPNERSREDVKQYDLVTNVNLGQLLPKKWGINVPLNYGTGEEIITPEYDQLYKDLKLENRLEAASSKEEEKEILKQSQDYTKRESLNLIGVKKNKTGESRPHIYDVENLTFNFTHNKTNHRDFEIENSLDENVKAGMSYNYGFSAKPIEPFKKNDSLFMGEYWKLIKDFNFNLLPNSLSFTSNYNRQFNKQRYRNTELGEGNLAVQDLFRRNYTFDMNYAINFNLTKSLSLNYSANNSSIVRNYFIDDKINGRQDSSLDVWDSFFDTGDPNRYNQQIQLNYKLPLDKIPFLKFIQSSYSYSGDFQWQKGSDLNSNLEITDDSGVTNIYDLGHYIQNSNTHSLNSSLNMAKFYSFVGIDKLNKKPTKAKAKDKEEKPKFQPFSLLGRGLGALLTCVKRVQVNYSENNGTYLPGYMDTPGTFGTVNPSLEYTLGLQQDVRSLSASKGLLTIYPDYNEQYSKTHNNTLSGSASIELIKELKIDLNANRTYADNSFENFSAIDSNGDGLSDVYNTLITNAYGNFNISTSLIKTAFKTGDENYSMPFESFKSNRLIVAHRQAEAFYKRKDYEVGADGYPLGFGKTNAKVLLPAFYSAYTDTDPNNTGLGEIKDLPIPNWSIKYNGIMKLKWFKDRFRRFSLNHGYRSSYTISQFTANLDYIAADPNLDYSDQAEETLDQGGNYKSDYVYSTVNLQEQFSPLARLDMEFKNSLKLLTEVKTDRVLSLSFDNNLLTEVKGKQYTFGLGYRFKDVTIKSKIAGKEKTVKSDLNIRGDLSFRDNLTIIRYLDIDNSQVTAGQSMWNFKFNADYAFSNNFSAIFFFDYSFADYAISTSFPQTTIRSGITLRYNLGN